jgi:signal transduction histidine kinase
MLRNFDLEHITPVLSKKELEDIKEYYHFSIATRDEITEKFNEEFKEHPIFGPLLKSMTKEQQEANNKENDRLLYLAVFENNWEPYVHSLLTQGVQYAHIGLDFKAWYEIIAVARKYYIPIWDKMAVTELEKVNAIRNGTNIMFDYVMCVIGESFIREKNHVINRQAKKQEAMIKELESFAYIISHDLKTPLRGIASLADWLVTDYKDKLDDTGKEYLDLLKGRVVRLEALIDGVLEYSRAGRTDVETSKVEFEVFVKEAIELVGAKPNVKIHVDTQLPILQASKVAMMQVFTNLIGNAIMHNDKENIEINIGAIEKESEWWFYIKDNGPGIEEEFQEKVFKIFQTLKTKDEMNSTGIGLAVVKKIIDNSGGRIWIESKAGEGCTFFFTLKK